MINLNYEEKRTVLEEGINLKAAINHYDGFEKAYEIQCRRILELNYRGDEEELQSQTANVREWVELLYKYMPTNCSGVKTQSSGEMKAAGIYKIDIFTPNFGVLSYVGQSSNVFNRLEAHLRSAKQGDQSMKKGFYVFLNCCKYNFTILEIVDDADKRLSREEYWIRKLQPFFNTHHNSTRSKSLTRSESMKRAWKVRKENS